MKKSTAFLFSILLAFCFSVNILAQETTGEIQGTVKDPAGAVIPNATVTISGVNVGFTRSINADGEGFFRARQIPPGVYSVKATAANFTDQTLQNVQVALGNATTVEFQLSVGSAQPNVVDVTTGGDVVAVDATDTKAQDTFNSREIEALPKGTNFTSLLRTGAATRNEPLSGQYQINGGSGAENSFIVDGQELSNFRTGALNGSNDIPYQAVQEVQVKASGFEAEFGGATGGVVTAVTKSGTNQYRGEFGAQFSTQKLNAGPNPVISNSLTAAGGADFQFVEYFRQERDKGTDFFPTASIGGPIIKDKFWFFGIYSPRIFNTTRTTNFVTGFGATRRPIGPQDFSTVLPSVVRNTPSTQTANLKQTNQYASIKLDASPTNTLRLSSSFTWNPIEVEGNLLGGTTVIGTPGFGDFGGNIGFLVGSDLTNRQGGRQNANNFRVEGVWTPNSKVVTTLRYSRGFLNEKLGSYFIPEAPRIRCRSVAASLVSQAGCTTGFQTNTNNFAIDRDVSIRNTVDADISYLISNFGGRHEIKGGYQFNRISNDVSQGYADQGIVNLCYGILDINTPCAGYGPPVSIPGPAPANVIGVGWVQRFSTNGKANNRNQALYIQDKWQPFNRLTLNLGVRTEQEDLPAFNGQTTNLKFNFGEKIAPRLGVAYDLTGDGKTKISAFYGWFYDRLKFELPRGSFGGDFFRRDNFYITSDNPGFFNYTLPRIIGGYNDPIGGGCPIAASATNPNRTRCNVDFRVPSNLPELRLSDGAPLQPGAVDPDLKPFRQSEVTVEFQREVLRSSVFTARYLYRNVEDAVEDAGFLTSTNSEFYIIANPGEGLHARRARELGFERVAKPQRRYDALQLEYDTRFIRNVALNVNYTYSRLYGNYSGLASSDENGRLSPGVNRFFDLPFVGYTASGQLDNGRLATDRPHVFKASGTYSFDWLGSNVNNTDFTVFTTAQSGTPLTTFVDIYGILIPETKRGDLGRTEMFTQTDFSLTHRYRFGRDNRFGVAFDLNILNVFNERNLLAVDNNKSSAFHILLFEDVAPTFVQAANILTSRGVISQLNASFAADPANINESYKLPILWQGPRTVRFGFRFLF